MGVDAHLEEGVGSLLMGCEVSEHPDDSRLGLWIMKFLCVGSRVQQVIKLRVRTYARVDSDLGSAQLLSLLACASNNTSRCA